MLEAMLMQGNKNALRPRSVAQLRGEVTGTDFITPEELAALVGLTAGVLLNNTTSWLMFTLNGQDVRVPKKPIRSSVTWNSLNLLGLVYGKAFTIKGEPWLVRLIQAASSDPALNLTGNDVESSWGSEWNSMFYHITNVVGGLTSEGISTGDQAQYTNADLGLGTNAAFRNLCQEAIVDNLSICAHRGSTHVSHFGGTSKGGGYHWRPILVKV